VSEEKEYRKGWREGDSREVESETGAEVGGGGEKKMLERLDGQGEIFAFFWYQGFVKGSPAFFFSLGYSTMRWDRFFFCSNLLRFFAFSGRRPFECLRENERTNGERLRREKIMFEPANRLIEQYAVQHGGQHYHHRHRQHPSFRQSAHVFTLFFVSSTPFPISVCQISSVVWSLILFFPFI